MFREFEMEYARDIDGPTNPSFNRGYFTAIMEPYALKEQLEKVLTSNQKLSPEVLRKVKELNNRITDDDNCIVFIGKLKTKSKRNSESHNHNLSDYAYFLTVRMTIRNPRESG